MNPRKLYNFLTVFVVALLTTGIWSCAGNDEFDELFEASRTKIITPKTVTFGGNETSTSFSIEAKGYWEISNIPEWFTLSQTAGTGNATVTLTTTDSENPSPTGNRTAKLTVISGDRTGEIEVIQAKAAPFLYIEGVDNGHIDLNKDATTRVFNIKTNTAWQISCSQKWFSISPDKGTGSAQVTITVEENTLEALREDNISINSINPTGYSANFTISQTGIQTSLSVSRPYLNATATAGTGTITIDGGDASWRLSVDQPWLHITSSTEGKGTGVIKLAWDETNTTQERTANVIIKRLYSDEVLETCVVTQAAGTTPVVSKPVAEAHKTYAYVSSKAAADIAVTERGFEYYKAGEPNNKTKIIVPNADTDGSFTAEITGLESMTTYHVRAYAINNVGATYSEEIEFTTTGSKPGESDNSTPEV